MSQHPFNRRKNPIRKTKLESETYSNKPPQKTDKKMLTTATIQKGNMTNIKFNMKFKNLGLVLVVAGLAFAGTAGAQSSIPSGLGFVPLGFPGGYSSSTLSICANNEVNEAPFGVFAGIVPDPSPAQGNAVVISGISSSPETVDILDFFQFGPSPANDQYMFTLTSIAETSAGVFQGAGTLVDSSDAYTFTDSTFTLAFAGQYNYNVTFDTVAEPVPEPTTTGCFLLGLVALACCQHITRNRRSR